MDVFADIAGWTGSLCLLAAYFWTSQREGASDQAGFHLLNIAGGIGLGINTHLAGALPPTILNAVWVCVGFLALRRILITRSKTGAIQQNQE